MQLILQHIKIHYGARVGGIGLIGLSDGATVSILARLTRRNERLESLGISLVNPPVDLFKAIAIMNASPDHGDQQCSRDRPLGRSAYLSFLVDLGESGPFNLTVIAAAIAIGSSVQAVSGAWLVRRFVGFPHPFDTERAVVTFLGLGGPPEYIAKASSGEPLDSETERH